MGREITIPVPMVILTARNLIPLEGMETKDAPLLLMEVKSEVQEESALMMDVVHQRGEKVLLAIMPKVEESLRPPLRGLLPTLSAELPQY